MRFLLGMGLVICTHLSASSTFLTQIHRMETSTRPDEETLVFLTNGRVVKVSPHDVSSLEEARRGQRKHRWLSIQVNVKREVERIEKARSPINTELDVPLMEREVLLDYDPSVIPSLDEVRSLFSDHRIPREGETQCYNRAHVWAYDWRTKKNIYSRKIWVYFTAKYIRKYNFEWWFHVSPMVNVNVDGKIKERVMDMKYSRGPNTTRQWTDIFLKDDAPCPTVTLYSDHADYPESGSCFIMKSSMYFYQPIDIELKEKFGTDKTAWVASEVVQAYQEAFDISVDQ